MPLEEIQKKLVGCWNYRIVKTLHFEKIRQPFHQISDKDIEENLKNPSKLAIAEVEYWTNARKKFILWFRLSNTTGHKYYVEIDDIEKTIKIITGVKLRLRWQKKVEKYGKRKN